MSILFSFCRLREPIFGLKAKCAAVSDPLNPLLSTVPSLSPILLQSCSGQTMTRPCIPVIPQTPESPEFAAPLLRAVPGG
jgi:hypothetical protein